MRLKKCLPFVTIENYYKSIKIDHILVQTKTKVKVKGMVRAEAKAQVRPLSKGLSFCASALLVCFYPLAKGTDYSG